MTCGIGTSILTQTNNDLLNTLKSLNLPVLMLTADLYVRNFTPAAQRLMGLSSSDIGRPFANARMNFRTDDLESMFDEILETLTPLEKEIQGLEGHWYLLRARPYLTADDKLDGLVVMLIDVDHLHRSRHELQHAHNFALAMLEDLPLAVAVVDETFKIRYINEAFSTLIGHRAEDLKYCSFSDLAAALWNLKQPLLDALDALKNENSFVLEHAPSDKGDRVLCIRGKRLRIESGDSLLIAVEDITAQRETARMLKVERERLTAEVDKTTTELNQTRDDLRSLAAGLFKSQEDERRRVARELHDDICQQLTSIEIDVRHIEQTVVIPPQAHYNLQEVCKRVGDLSEEVHRTSRRLHPAIIEDLGLRAALESLIDDFREREQMITTFSAGKVPQNIPAETAIVLYRIAQEALRNIAKHAGKTHVKVHLSRTGKNIHLSVTDLGDGFNVNDRRTGLGLIGMEERARLVGGAVKVTSIPGEGTKVITEVPLDMTP